MQKFTLLSLLLCLSLTIHAQTTAGPVVNTASVSIEADSDADNDGKVIIKTKGGIERVTVSNDGKVGIATDTPAAFIDINPPSTGPHAILSVRSNEPGAANFGMGYYTTPNIYQDPTGILEGPPRRNLKSYTFGYNVQGTAGQNPNETSLYTNTEIGYITAQGRPQDEWWMSWCNPGHPCYRWFGFDGYRDNGSAQAAFRIPRLLVGDRDQANFWLEFTSTSTAGNLNLYNDSGINYNGTRTYFVTHNGLGMLGRDLSNSRQYLFGFGSAQMEDARFFKGSTLLSGPLSLSVGAEGAAIRAGANLRWQATGNFPGFSDIQTAFDVDEADTASKLVKRDSAGAVHVTSVKIDGTVVLDGQCAAILNPEVGERINNVTTIAILDCLRAIKLLAQ